MKKIFSLAMALCLASAATLHAGGLMTNTNYHIAFDRMMARGATFEIDGTYSNPAGTVWGHEGWQVSFNWQNPHQWRNVEATYPNFYNPTMTETTKFKGKASAPFVPGLFAAYKHNRWALSAMLGIVGSGGTVTYDQGVPMFVVPVRGMMATRGLAANQYDLDAWMKGRQFVYGAQLNFAYRISDHWSAAVGLRGNIYDGYNRGHVVANMVPAVQAALGAPTPELLNMQIDVDQRGFGLNPLVSLNYRYKGLTLTGRYEFRTKLNIPNETKTLSVSPAAVAATVGGMAAPYQDKVKTRYDLPALLVLAAGYEILPNLRVATEYHFFDDKNAKMAGDRQKEMTRGTQEFLLGLEWDINKTFTVSCGAQRTDYGVNDRFQSNTSFACDSYSVGLGGAVNVNSHLRFNIGYFCSLYSDYDRQTTYMAIPVSETYSRTNHVFGLGVDYKF